MRRLAISLCVVVVGMVLVFPTLAGDGCPGAKKTDAAKEGCKMSKQDKASCDKSARKDCKSKEAKCKSGKADKKKGDKDSKKACCPKHDKKKCDKDCKKACCAKQDKKCDKDCKKACCAKADKDS